MVKRIEEVYIIGLFVQCNVIYGFVLIFLLCTLQAPSVGSTAYCCYIFIKMLSAHNTLFQ